jgi:ribonuclease BN (tRNA processing enzyme)
MMKTKNTALLILLGSVFLSLGCAAATQVKPQECESSRVKLQMLGTRGPEFLDAQASTGYLIWLDDKARVIIDAGPGSLQRFKQSGADFVDVELMLFTHFHADHSADFPAYIKAGFFTERRQKLQVIGPSGTTQVASAKEFVDRAIGSEHGLYPYLGAFINEQLPSRYKIKVKTLPWSINARKPKQIYNNQQDIMVSAVSVHHGPFPAHAYRVDLAGCSIAFSGDMSGLLKSLPNLAHRADILIAHNAISEDTTGIAAKLHMTPTYIGEVAKEAQVKQLLLTHLMARSLAVKSQTLSLIDKNYQGKVSFPKDLEVIHP